MVIAVIALLYVLKKKTKKNQKTPSGESVIPTHVNCYSMETRITNFHLNIKSEADYTHHNI